MAKDYYNRKATKYIDGTPMFKTEEDRKSESIVAEELGSLWSCEFVSFGELSPIDWFVQQDGRIVGVAELKSPRCTSETYPNVILNVRKWLALGLAGLGLGVPALFIARFTDGVIYWIRLWEVDAKGGLQMGGCSSMVKARSDQEPVIMVPRASMYRIESKT